MNKIKVKGTVGHGYTDWQFTCADHFNAWTATDTWADAYEAAIGHAAMHHPRPKPSWSPATIEHAKRCLAEWDMRIAYLDRRIAETRPIPGRGKW